jgi:Asp-tRNA(Asn)/Glu-tRNA(Gln) amidotransferase C subunit
VDILRQIQSDLLRQDAALSNILRKAKVLASQLRSDELGSWVSQELDGYKSKRELPDYRVLTTGCVGNLTDGFSIVERVDVPVWEVKDDRLREQITTFWAIHGIRTIERFAVSQDQHFRLTPALTALVNSIVGEEGCGYVSLELAVGPPHFEQILDTVRNRLLEFVLKLDENWHIDDKPPSKDEVKHLVQVMIYNNQPGANMSVFDQRGQQVSYQYNAAGNINMHSGLNRNELAHELEKLRGEVERAKELRAIDQNVAVEAEYHLMQATKEVRKDKPDKSSFLEHVHKTKSVLEGVAAATGLVTALVKAVEIASKIFN